MDGAGVSCLTRALVGHTRVQYGVDVIGKERPRVEGRRHMLPLSGAVVRAREGVWARILRPQRGGDLGAE